MPLDQARAVLDHHPVWPSGLPPIGPLQVDAKVWAAALETATAQIRQRCLLKSVLEILDRQFSHHDEDRKHNSIKCWACLIRDEIRKELEIDRSSEDPRSAKP